MSKQPPTSETEPEFCPDCGETLDETTHQGREPDVMDVWELTCQSCGTKGLTVPLDELTKAAETFDERVEGAKGGHPSRRPGGR